MSECSCGYQEISQLREHIKTYVTLNVFEVSQSDIDDHIRMMVGEYDWLVLE